MAGILVYSPKCNHCNDIIRFVQDNSVLQSMVQYHNVNTQGIPSDKVTRVPTMITKNGKFLVGQEIKAWLGSLLPQEITNCCIGGNTYGGCDLEDPDGDSGDLFNLNSYGQSLQPVITKELQDKINRKVTEAFSEPQQ